MRYRLLFAGFLAAAVLNGVSSGGCGSSSPPVDGPTPAVPGPTPANPSGPAAQSVPRDAPSPPSRPRSTRPRPTPLFRVGPGVYLGELVTLGKNQITLEGGPGVELQGRGFADPNGPPDAGRIAP